MTTSPSEMQAVVPWSGELVDITKPEVAADQLAASADWYNRLRNYQELCRAALRAESDRRGQRTFPIGGYTIEVSSPETAIERVYDTDRLWNELEAAGLPAARLGELITMVPKVDGMVLRQLRRTPKYAEIIDECVLSTKEKTRSVRVK